MINESELVRFIQSHKALEPFNYKIAIDWAIELIREGKETDNILILASFSIPIEKHEISTYVTAVLNELGLEELEGDEALIAQTHFLLIRILKDESIRENLQFLSQICINNDYDKRVINFYLLYHGWLELEDIGVNYYYRGVNLGNIEAVLKLEARIWIDKHIYGKKNLELQQTLKDKTSSTKSYKNNFGKSEKIKGNTKNKSRSWWKKLWP